MKKKTMGFLTWLLLLAMVVAQSASVGTVSASLLEAPPLTLVSGPAAAPTVVGSVTLDSRSPSNLVVNPGTDRVYFQSYVGVSVGAVTVVDASVKANPVIVTALTAYNYQGLTLNPTTNRFYSTDGYGGNILVYNGDNNALITSVSKGYCHSGMDTDPTTNLIYTVSQCGGILNFGTLTITNSSSSGNSVTTSPSDRGLCNSDSSTLRENILAWN